MHFGFSFLSFFNVSRSIHGNFDLLPYHIKKTHAHTKSNSDNEYVAIKNKIPFASNTNKPIKPYQ